MPIVYMEANKNNERKIFKMLTCIQVYNMICDYVKYDLYTV